MDSKFKLVFVKTSNLSKKTKANQSNKGVVNGELFVQQPHNFQIENFSERVRIVIAIKGFGSNNDLKSERDWHKILERQNPLSINSSRFQISEDNWFTNGITWVVPTSIFSTTSFRINLEESHLLTSGFIIEIYQRDAAFVKEVQPSFNLRDGVIINFVTSWHLHSNPIQASLRRTIGNDSDDSED